MNPTPLIRIHPLIPVSWLICSGAAALSFQALWIHYFRILLGNTIFSFSWTTSVFLLGLALGSLLASLIRFDKIKRPLIVYGLLESLVGLLALTSLVFLAQEAEGLHKFLHPKSIFKDGFLALVFILPPTVIMGMTFPLLYSLFSRSHKAETLYGWNTVGGGLGLLFLAFLGVKFFGYYALIYLTTLFAMVPGIWAITCSFRVSKTQIGLTKTQTSKLTARKCIIAFFSGFVLLGFQVVWFRSLEIIINDRAYISTLVLFLVLTILGLCSLLAPKIKESKFQLLPLFLICALSSFIFAESISTEAFLVARGYPRVTWIKYAYVGLTFVLPLFFLGFIFPTTIGKDKADSPPLGSQSLASLLMLNTIGGMLGTVWVSYYVVEIWGMKSFYIISAPIILVIILLTNKSTGVKKTIFSTYSILALALSLFLWWQIDTRVYIARPDKVLFTEENPYGVFSLIERDGKKEIYSGNYRIVAPFESQNVAHAQNGLAFYPTLFHPSPQKILNMGVGYGITLSAFLELDPEVVRSVEILEPVYKVSPYFKSKNKEWYNSKKIEKIVDDARGYLSRSPEKFDIISANIASPYSTAGSFFLTKEYFKEVKGHLKPGGVYSQLIWGPHLKEIIHTFKLVFPYIKAIPGYTDYDLILIGSSGPLKKVRSYKEFSKTWPLYKGSISRKKTEEIGKSVLEKQLNGSPSFIISDHKADLTHSLDKELSFFWIYR